MGNSYIYYNNLPEIVAKLAEAGGQTTVEYQMVAPGGWRLKDHWEKGEARELLHRDHWDYVVLQEHSTLGVYFILDGQCRVSTDSLFCLYANRWAAEIGERGATPLFFLTWARQWAPSDQAILNYAYITAGKETHSMIAPVGIAWNLLRETGSDIELYVEDGSHPSAAGSYLAGCTFYATIFKQNPISLPAKIYGTPFNLETSKVDSGITALLVDLTADQARSIQVSAWTATQMFIPLGEYPEVSPAPSAELAQLPPGERLNPQLLAGVWSGQIRFFDLTDPVDMKLRFQLRNAAWHIGIDCLPTTAVISGKERSERESEGDKSLGRVRSGPP